jgi:hypothetical protein
VVFGAVELGNSVGQCDDQRRLRRTLALAARRAAKMGGAVP